MKIKVSVIIPVYNMEKYIGNALESVCQQSLKELEIICIDDGSTDGTLEVLRNYEKNFSQIVVYSQENQGSGVARNNGISKAQGEYICFLDADDSYASEDALEYLYNTAKEKGVYICGGSACDMLNGVISTQFIRPERNIKEDGYIFSKDYPGCRACYTGFIYERQFICKNNILFPTYLRGQDAPFFISVLGKAKKIYCVKKLIWIYQRNHKEVVFDIKKALDFLKAYRDIIKISGEYQMKKIHQGAVEDLQGFVGALLYRCAWDGVEEAKSLAEEIKNYISDDLLEGNCENNIYTGDRIDEFIKITKEREIQFLELIKSKKYIYIYGAGVFGKRIQQYLLYKGINIDAFIVTNKKDNEKNVNGIMIVDIDSDKIIKKDYLIIIGTAERLQPEIVQTLHDRKLMDYYSFRSMEIFLWQEKMCF